MYKELPGIPEDTYDFEKIEAQILDIFRKRIYLPLIEYLKPGNDVLKNDMNDDIIRLILSGDISFYRGAFTGKTSSTFTKSMRKIGAIKDDKGRWAIRQDKLSSEIRMAIMTSDARFKQKAKDINEILDKVLPEEFTNMIKIDKAFDSTLWRVNKRISSQLKNITVNPVLTDEERGKISSGYTKDLERYIQDFAKEEIGKLRKNVEKRSLSGARYEGMISEIKKSYGVSERKAKFLARQETGLMMAQFKKARYQSAGINWYKWKCVAGSEKHPVRPYHEKLNDTIQEFDKPPKTDKYGNTNNPGEDYNCRCIARPIVRF